MERNQKTAAKKLLDRAVQSHRYAENCGRFLRQFLEPSEPSLPTPTFDDGGAVRVAFSDGAEKLFGAFGLDAKNPFDWHRLVFSLSLEFFPSPQVTKRRGAPKKRTDRYYVQLLVDFNEAKTRSPNKSEDRICEGLKSNPRYNNLQPRTIRRNLDRARDPQFNECLKRTLRLMDDLMTDFDHLPTPSGSKLREIAIRILIENSRAIIQGKVC